MQYTQFRSRIQAELRRHPDGLNWAELSDRLKLPYARPCPTWVKQLEQEIGLQRTTLPDRGRAKIWSLG